VFDLLNICVRLLLNKHTHPNPLTRTPFLHLSVSPRLLFFAVFVRSLFTSLLHPLFGRVPVCSKDDEYRAALALDLAKDAARDQAAIDAAHAAAAATSAELDAAQRATAALARARASLALDLPDAFTAADVRQG
jgi:hypothetical protein